MAMEKLTSILLVLDGTAADTDLMSKAVTLARRCSASLELFLCDAERAYVLRHAFDPTGIEESRQSCLRLSRQYLEDLKNSVATADVRILVDAACVSPLYEAIVHKVQKSHPDLVMKNAAGGGSLLRRFAWEANDWQLMRTCPVTLMLSRGKPWRGHPTFAAAVDVSEQETLGLARAILETSVCLTLSGAQLDVLYTERMEDDAAGREARREALHRLARGAHVDAERVHVLSGSPEQALPMFAAERDYDVLVMGALTHRKGLASLVGTLTGKLVEFLDCDFVLVKPSTYRCPISEDPAASHVDTTTGAPGHPQRDSRLGLLSPW
jgi:universal stress protein E